MNRKTLKITTIMLAAVLLLCGRAQAEQPPKMPFVFEKFCFSCHREQVLVGPASILDMRSRAGNPLHEEYIRSNIRFGLNSMPAFRPSEVSDKGMDAIVSYLKALAAYRKTHPDYQPTLAHEGKVKK